MGWDVNVHVNLQKQLMLRTRGVGGVGWDVNVHVNLQKQLMLRTPGLGQYIYIYIYIEYIYRHHWIGDKDPWKTQGELLKAVRDLQLL